MDTRWKKRQINIALLVTVLAGFITAYTASFSDRNYYDMRIIFRNIFFTSLPVFIAGGLTLYGMLLDNSYYGKNQMEYQKKVKSRFLYAQYIILFIAFMLCIIWVTDDRMDYNITFYMSVFVIPLFTELILQYHYLTRKYSDTAKLNTLCELFRQFEIEKYIEKNPFIEGSAYYSIIETLKNTGDTMRTALEKQLKSERTKVELISNISHDLKTPLTAMTNYIELLKKEELEGSVSEYAEILAAKSIRLKEMIESLFDLAKTTSGNAELVMEQIDMNRLAEQTLADMEEVITGSKLDFRVQLSEHPLFFEGDGSHLYRVLQNLVENAIKYSLEGTRVFVTISESSHEVKFKIVNTSKYEMKFTEENIVERFTRGDEARSTDGNGLGIAIAKSYTEACGGEFMVYIEGDQFKAELVFLKMQK